MPEIKVGDHVLVDGFLVSGISGVVVRINTIHVGRGSVKMVKILLDQRSYDILRLDNFTTPEFRVKLDKEYLLNQFSQCLQSTLKPQD